MHITISYILQKAEYIEAFDTYESRKLSQKIDIAASCFLIIIGLTLLILKLSTENILLAFIFMLV